MTQEKVHHIILSEKSCLLNCIYCIIPSFVSTASTSLSRSFAENVNRWSLAHTPWKGHQSEWACEADPVQAGWLSCHGSIKWTLIYQRFPNVAWGRLTKNHFERGFIEKREQKQISKPHRSDIPSWEVWEEAPESVRKIWRFWPTARSRLSRSLFSKVLKSTLNVS